MTGLAPLVASPTSSAARLASVARSLLLEVEDLAKWEALVAAMDINMDLQP